jgi:hypothetical protein
MRIVAAASAFITLFLYLFSLNLSILPLGVGSRVYLGLAGMAVLCLNLVFARRKARRLDRQFGSIIGCLFLLAVAALTSVLFNQSSDIELVKYVVSMLVILAAAYLLVTVFIGLYGRAASRKIIYFIIACVALQCVLAVAMFLIPGLRDALLGLLNSADLESDLISSIGEFRLIGFGSTFFGAGIINGMALLLIVFCFRHLAPAGPAQFALGGAYVLTALVGMLMSRTTALGIIISLLYLHLGGLAATAAEKQAPVRYYRNFVASSLLTVSLLLVLVLLLIDIDLIMPVLDWAFEPIFNYFSGQGLKSESTDQLIDMYGGSHLGSLPLALGDAKFTDPNDASLYYQHVDIGYLRLIYYFGVPGLLAYLLFQLRTAACTITFFDGDKLFVCALGLYLLLLNFKGFADIFPFTILFFLFAYLNVQRAPPPSRHAAGLD